MTFDKSSLCNWSFMLVCTYASSYRYQDKSLTLHDKGQFSWSVSLNKNYQNFYGFSNDRKNSNKVCPIENNTNLDSIFYLVKVQKLLLFFYLHLTWLLAHDITKEFWKNSHFENMRAVFLLSCQNSLRWEKSLICHWNIDSWRQKLSFGCVMVPKNNQNII